MTKKEKIESLEERLLALNSAVNDILQAVKILSHEFDKITRRLAELEGK